MRDFSIIGFGTTERGNSQLWVGFIVGICIPKMSAQNPLKTHVISEITECGILKYFMETTYLIEFFVIDSTNKLYREEFYKSCFISKLNLQFLSF
jgi:hypothetical protein